MANGKPAPDLFLLAASTMGLPPSRCVVIEDSRPGVNAALAAGMAAFGYCPLGDIWGLNELGVQTFRDMSELPGLLRVELVT